jgi:hypothetical protein
MGAEQSGYLVKGPAKITAARVRAAVRACLRLRRELLASAADPESSADREKVAYDRTGIEFDPLEIPDDPTPAIRDFVDWWRTLGGGDTCSRTDPDDPKQVLVYAGDMTYGDEPDGYGYRKFKQAFAWGYAGALGVR